MIYNIMELLRLLKFEKQSDNIAIAKGKYEMPLTIKEFITQIKNRKSWQIKN
jgi:hypothetical protein